MTFTEQELLHYSRHFNLSQVGRAGQERLKNARVLCIGAGGLGSAALLYLAAAGVGTIGMVDDDQVEISNLQRQILYSYNDVGQQKTKVATARLQQLNPAIQIIPHQLRLSHSNALEIISQYDLIADGSDNFATRYLVNDACFQLKKPHVYASIAQFEGQCSVLTTANGPCFRCLFASPPPAHLIPNCAAGGVLGVLPGVMGSIQATEIIKLILGIGEPLIGRLLLFNALEMRFREVMIPINPDCPLCTHRPQRSAHTFSEPLSERLNDEISVSELQDLRKRGDDFLLLDVREPVEYQICHLNGTLIPLKELPTRMIKLDKNKNIIVHCKHGGRSLQAMQLLQANGFNNVRNLSGGIIAWIEKIDGSMRKY